MKAIKHKLMMSVVSLLLLIIISFIAYLFLSPRIIIQNQSNTRLLQVIIQLPSNRIVFDNVAASAQNKIYYSWTQSEGVYRFQVNMENSVSVSGECGSITNHQVAKELKLLVHPDLSIECIES